MKNIKKIILSFLCIGLLFGSEIVEAATYVGDSFTVTLACSSKDVEGAIKFTASNATITSISPNENFCERSRTFTVKAKANNTGKAVISMVAVDAIGNVSTSPYELAAGTVITSKTVTISSNSGSGGGGTTTPSTPKSGDNALKSLTVNVGTLTPSFNPSVTDYTLALGPDISKINVNGIANHQKASVSGNGDMDLTVGENIIKITVTAENGNPKVYKITAIVDDAPLVFVKFNDKELGVVRNLLTIPALSGFEPTTVKIEDKEINAWYSQTRNITVLYLQDENSKDFYLYDEVNGITSKYVPHTINGNQLGFIDIPEEIQEKKGFTYQEVIIDDKPLMGWVFNSESFANYALIYAMNENGQFNYYQYENTQKSLQLYSNAAPIPFDEFNEELNKKDNEIDTYKMYFYCACGAAAFLFVCLIISIINSNRYKKRLIAKTNRENKVD